MIKVLEQSTIDKIAAGEVIERPLSIVKELIENSVDAGSTRITVEIKEGGISMIRVTDNGCGIAADEVRTAYLSHATSKLNTADDLVGIGTLGFRGEALSTIAAVTETEMITKTRDSMTGVKYVIKGGKEEELVEIGAPDGTTIISKNIFFNTPARLKFLKTSMTEGAYISDLVNHMALSHPEISFKLISNGKNVISTAGDGRLKETIYSLYGSDITKSLLPVDYSYEDIRITGFIGKPFLSKGNRSFENYFVNKRYIKSNVINKAIEEAYKTYVMQHRFPFTVLFLEVNPESCDVNIHPAKLEFRYDNEKALFHAVFHAVHDTLQEKELLPDAEADYGQRQTIYTPIKQNNAERSKYQAEQIRISDSRNLNTLEQLKNTETRSISNILEQNIIADTQDSNSSEQLKNTDAQSVSNISEQLKNTETQPVSNISEHNRNTESQNLNSPEQIKNSATGTGLNTESARRSDAANIKSFSSINNSGSSSKNSYSILESILPKEYRDQLHESRSYTESEAVNPDNEAATSSKSEAIASSESDSVSVNSDALLKAQGEQLKTFQYLSKEALSKHHIIGQLFKTYWLTEYNNELYIMDQHAAHEKVNYETFLAEFKERRIVSQQLFPPLIITLSAAEKLAVMDNIEYFNKTGFEIGDFGGNEVNISAVPVNLIGLDPKDIFLEFAEYLSSGVTGLTEDIFVRKLGTMGCKAAIKGNQEISLSEAEALIEKLLTLENPYTCPHGRPTIIRMTKDELDKKFKRIVE